MDHPEDEHVGELIESIRMGVEERENELKVDSSGSFDNAEIADGPTEPLEDSIRSTNY